MRHLRLLFWLRWKYLWRSALTRRVAMALGWVISFMVAAFMIWMIVALFEAAQSRGVADDVFAEYLALAFAVLYLGWLYFSSLSDLFDPVRLASYPIPPRRIFLGSALSTVIGPMPVYAAGIWIGIAWGWPAPTGVMLMRAAMFLVLVAHLVMVSRLLRLTFLQLLTSRRWRDLGVIMGAVMGGGTYIAFQFLRTSAGSEKMTDTLRWIGDAAEAHSITTWLCWMPGTWFAWAFQAQGWGSVAAAAGAVASTLFVAWLGGRAEERLAFSEPVFAYTPKAKRVEGAPKPFLRGLAGAVGRLFGDDVAGIARKEVLLIQRDPTVRSRLIMGSFYVVLLFVWPMLSKRSSGPQISPAVSGFVLLFAEMQILLNIFGTDGTALRALSAMPVPRGRLVLGKNIAHAAVFLFFNLAAISLFTLMYGRRTLEDGTVATDYAMLPADLAIHVAAFLVMLGSGSLFSVFFPVVVVSPGQRLQRRDEEQGCLYTIARTAAVFGVMGLVAPLGGARALLSPEGGLKLGLGGHIGLVAAALIFGVAVYALTAWGTAKALRQREEKLIDVMARA